MLVKVAWSRVKCLRKVQVFEQAVHHQRSKLKIGWTINKDLNNYIFKVNAIQMNGVCRPATQSLTLIHNLTRAHHTSWMTSSLLVCCKACTLISCTSWYFEQSLVPFTSGDMQPWAPPTTEVIQIEPTSNFCASCSHYMYLNLFQTCRVNTFHIELGSS